MIKLSSPHFELKITGAQCRDKDVMQALLAILMDIGDLEDHIEITIPPSAMPRCHQELTALMSLMFTRAEERVEEMRVCEPSPPLYKDSVTALESRDYQLTDLDRQALENLTPKAQKLAEALLKMGAIDVPTAMDLLGMEDSKGFGGIIGTARRHLAEKGLTCPIGSTEHPVHGYRIYVWEPVEECDPLITEKVGRKRKHKPKDPPRSEMQASL